MKSILILIFSLLPFSVFANVLCEKFFQEAKHPAFESRYEAAYYAIDSRTLEQRELAEKRIIQILSKRVWGAVRRLNIRTEAEMIDFLRYDLRCPECLPELKIVYETLKVEKKSLDQLLERYDRNDPSLPKEIIPYLQEMQPYRELILKEFRKFLAGMESVVQNKTVGYFKIISSFEKASLFLSFFFKDDNIQISLEKLKSSDSIGSPKEFFKDWVDDLQRDNRKAMSIDSHASNSWWYYTALLPFYSFYRSPKVMTTTEQLYYGLIRGIKINGLGPGVQFYDEVYNLSKNLTGHDDGHSRFQVMNLIENVFTTFESPVERVLIYLKYADRLDTLASAKLNPEQRQRFYNIFVQMIHEIERTDFTNIDTYIRTHDSSVDADIVDVFRQARREFRKYIQLNPYILYR